MRHRSRGGGKRGNERVRARAGRQWWPRLEIRKEINSAIDKRPVKRQSVPVWVDEALSILDKKHNRRYLGDIERACLLCLPLSGSPASFFFPSRKSSRCRNTRCNARDLFRFAFLSPLLSSFLPFSTEGLQFYYIADRDIRSRIICNCFEDRKSLSYVILNVV